MNIYDNLIIFRPPVKNFTLPYVFQYFFRRLVVAGCSFFLTNLLEERKNQELLIFMLVKHVSEINFLNTKQQILIFNISYNNNNVFNPLKFNGKF